MGGRSFADKLMRDQLEQECSMCACNWTGTTRAEVPRLCPECGAPSKDEVEALAKEIESEKETKL